MSGVTDLFSNPWFIAIALIDFVLIVATVRLALNCDRLRLKWLWIPLAIVWPLAVIVMGSTKFRRKRLWLAFAILTPSITLGLVESQNCLFSLSFAPLIVVAWWLWAPDPETSIPAES